MIPSFHVHSPYHSLEQIKWEKIKFKEKNEKEKYFEEVLLINR